MDEQARIAAIREQARMLARENKLSDPDITRVYWFPNPEEIRLIELETTMPRSMSDAVEPFYFPASVQYNVNSPSGIAMIRPSEYRILSPPSGWGTWDEAEELEIDA